MSAVQRTSHRRSNVKRWISNLLIICVVLLSMLAFALVSTTDSSARLNARQVFESSRWNALQLQLQTYRLTSYISHLQQEDFPLNGNAYFQYDLVMSRVDLLREGEIGHHIRNFANGRATRLLNIITGELELVSLNLEHLEEGQIAQIPLITERLQALDSQITDFVVIVNRGANEYMTQQRDMLDEHLTRAKNIAFVLLSTVFLLVLLAIRVAQDQRYTSARNRRLEEKVQDSQKEKTDVIARIASDLEPSINAMVDLCSTTQQDVNAQPIAQPLQRLADMSSQLLTQLNGYQDLTLIEANQLNLSPQQGNLREHIEQTLASLDTLFAIHHTRIICTMEPNLPNSAEVDFHRLHEVIATLLVHTLPYSDSSPVVVNVRPSNSTLAEDNDHHPEYEQKVVQISIKDRGRGLPEAVQTGLRRNPHNPTNTILNQIHDIGIGFTFCHRLITAMGGELHFSSSQEHGTEIWLDIPMYLPKVTTLPKPPPRNTWPIVALIESHPLVTQALKTSLENCAHRTLELNAAQLQQCVKRPDELNFNSLLLTDPAWLTDSDLNTLQDLAVMGVRIITTKDVTQTLPKFFSHSLIQYPITQTQLVQQLNS